MGTLRSIIDISFGSIDIAMYLQLVAGCFIDTLLL